MSSMQAHYLFNRKNNGSYIGAVSRPVGYHLKYQEASNVTFSTSFIQMLRGFAQEGCVISKLLISARLWQNYVSDKHVNYVAMREKKGMISFMPFGKTQTFTDDHQWSKKDRQEIKPAKFARTFLNPRLVKRLNDSHFNSFATRFKAFDEDDIEITSTSFENGYASGNYQNTLDSCMIDKPVAEFYESFDCEMLVARRKSGRFVGRAILWKNAKLVNSRIVGPPDVKIYSYMDRVYTTAPEFNELFRQYANENGYLHRCQTNGGFVAYHLNDKSFNIDDGYGIFISPIEPIMEKKFKPYLDTFRYGNCDLTSLSSVDVVNSRKYSMTCTDGTIGDNGFMYGAIRTYEGRYELEENCILYGGHHYSKFNSSYVSTCIDDGLHYYIYDPRLVYINGGGYYLKEGKRVAFCEHSHEYIHKKYAVQVYNKNGNLITVHKNYVYLYNLDKKEVAEIEKEYKFTTGNDKFRQAFDSKFIKDYYSNGTISDITMWTNAYTTFDDIVVSPFGFNDYPLTTNTTNTSTPQINDF